jgi:hypothetical protein
VNAYADLAALLHAAGVTPTEEAIMAALRPRAPDPDTIWAQTVLDIGRTFGYEGEDDSGPDTVRPGRCL